MRNFVNRFFIFMIHHINIAIHIAAGFIAMVLGIIIIVQPKGTLWHSKIGRYYLYLLLVVVATGVIGWMFFRSNNPFLLMLTLLSGYNGYSGYRIVKLKDKRTANIDATIAAAALISGILFLLWIRQSTQHWSPSVIYSTLYALAFVTVYDLLKHFWLHRWIKSWWIHEHIYKMLSTFGALFSAFVGNVLRDFKPYSQIFPSALVMLLIIYFIARRLRSISNSKIVKPVSTPE
jgi:hypothetical protein